MLNGLGIAEERFSEVSQQRIMRLEAEFYIAASHTKSSFVFGEDATEFVQYGTSEELNAEERGYPVLRLNEFESWFIGRPTKYCDKIDRQLYESLKLKAGDVLICRTNGNPKLVGKSAIVMKNVNYAFASYLFRVRPTLSVINSETLMVYLNSKIGRAEIEKYSMVSNQANFSPAKYREIQIPVLSAEIQHRISELVIASYQTLEQSKGWYAEAESLLLDELGLQDLQPSDEHVVVKSFSASFKSTGRLDAEFYNPSDSRIVEQCKSYKHGWHALGEIVESITNGVESRVFVDDGVPYIRVGDIRNLEIDLEKARRIPHAEAMRLISKIRLEVGDVLVVRSGSIGQAALAKRKDLESVLSSHLMRLRLKEDSPIRSSLLALFLSTTPGVRQTIMHSNGGVVPEISQPSLTEIIVPKVLRECQGKIESLIAASDNIRWESKRLLGVAKRGVEIAIEQDEATALKWMEQQSAT